MNFIVSRGHRSINKTLTKIIIIAAIILAVFCVSRINCIVLGLYGLPDKLKADINGKTQWLFLYGGNICPTCPTGEYVFKIAKDKSISYVFPGDYKKNDVDNFTRSFPVKGQILIADKELAKFYAAICRCVRKSKKNLLIELSPKGSIKLIKVI
jgi:hypothetical protein